MTQESPPTLGVWNVGAEEYHADRTADSSSTIKDFGTSPEYYRGRYIDGTLPKKDTDAMLLGSVLHCKLLEPEKFVDQYAVLPQYYKDPLTGEFEKLGKRKNVHKAYWAEWEAANEGKTLLTTDQMDKVEGMLKSIGRDPACIDQLAQPNPVIEHAIRFPYRGLQCKALLDFGILPGGPMPPVHMNIKTSKEPNKGGWRKAIQDFSYHISAALYSPGFEAVFGEKPLTKLLFAHSSPPYECGIFTLGPKSLAIGKEILDDLVDDLLAAKELDHFFGPDHGKETTIELPDWRLRQAGVFGD